jgi:enoyl-CoA hydratase
MTFASLLVEHAGGVTRVTFNRPRVLNALDRATLEELDAAVAAVASDPAVRVLVLSGGEGKAFVAGADIAAMAALGPVEAAAFSRLGHRVMARLEALDVPVIAEVNGFALGGGCELVLACDLVIAADRARFGQPEVKLGVIPGFGGTVRLTRRVGPGRARLLLYAGGQVDAAEALRIGLADEVVPAADLRARVDALAAEIVKNAPRAVAWAKRAVRLAEDSDLATGAAFEQELFGMCFATDDQKEGMRAFLDKRPAAWTGR